MTSDNNQFWDYIVVGARCAGASLATLLARQGAKVLLLEAAVRGSNKTQSTHLIRPPGVEVLRRLGLSKLLESEARPSPVFRLAFDDAELVFNSLHDQAPYCIRRQVVDTWLQDLAENAGVRFLDQHRVVDLIWDHGKVIGVRVKTPDQGITEYFSNWVVGADGAHSSIAKLVNAESYLDYTERERAGFFAYFDEPKRWPHQWDGTLEYLGDEFFFVFRCDNGQMLLVYGGDHDEVLSWPKEQRQTLFLQRLQRSPATAPLVANNQPVSRLIGVSNAHFYYRKPFGPGYALVGDAGNYTHYSTGCGMSHALQSAERLSAALLDGSSQALEMFWRQRDAETLPYYLDAINQAKIANNNAFTRALFRHLNQSPVFQHKVAQTLTGEVPINELVTAAELRKVLGAAVRTADGAALLNFFKAAPQQARQGWMISQAQRKLKQAQTELAQFGAMQNATVSSSP